MIEWPQFDPFAIHFTETTGVTWYGLTYLAGFVASWLLARKRAQSAHSPLKVAEVDDLIFYGAMGVLLGGRLGYMLFYASGAILDSTPSGPGDGPPLDAWDGSGACPVRSGAVSGRRIGGR